MAVAYFIIPYTRERGSQPNSVLRRVAIDDLTPQIQGAGHDWREVEIDGDRAVVRVDAPNRVLNLVRARGWLELSRMQAALEIQNNPRRKPRRNPLAIDPTHPDSLIFDGPVQPTRTLDQLDAEATATRAR